MRAPSKLTPTTLAAATRSDTDLVDTTLGAAKPQRIADQQTAELAERRPTLEVWRAKVNARSAHRRGAMAVEDLPRDFVHAPPCRVGLHEIVCSLCAPRCPAEAGLEPGSAT